MHLSFKLITDSFLLSNILEFLSYKQRPESSVLLYLFLIRQNVNIHFSKKESHSRFKVNEH